MNKQTMIIVAVTAVIVLALAPRLRQLPLIGQIPTV